MTKAISFGTLAGRRVHVCTSSTTLRPTKRRVVFSRVVLTRLVIPTYWLNRIYRRSISLRLTGTGCQVSGTNPFHWIFPEELAVCARTRACAPLRLATPGSTFHVYFISRHFEFYQSFFNNLFETRPGYSTIIK